MWVFSRSSFLSLIADPVDPECLLVRARIRTDIHHLWPKAVVDVTPWRDYKYRARIPRAEVAEALSREVTSITYGNFKDAAGLADKRRMPFYAWIWMAACEMQDALEPSGRPYRKPVK